MSLGRSPIQEDLHRSTRAACEARLGPKAIERLLARECHRLFPDEEFADLFAVIGRDSVPPRIVAVVMGAAAAARAIGPRGGRRLRFRSAMEVRGGYARFRSSGLRAHR